MLCNYLKKKNQLDLILAAGIPAFGHLWPLLASPRAADAAVPAVPQPDSESVHRVRVGPCPALGPAAACLTPPLELGVGQGRET